LNLTEGRGTGGNYSGNIRPSGAEAGIRSIEIVLKEMIVQGLIEYAIPDKPRSRLQR